jgi:hypothetical protein
MLIEYLLIFYFFIKKILVDFVMTKKWNVDIENSIEIWKLDF